ncbi:MULTISPECIES: DUF2975 domain-containing protein [unclassified Lysinibacillus]|uniref:DUF2975 domain-containing protein n=1 Tax=unclassified Lysinibacillus TaxID=2636778 RepID=UPI001FCE28FD|nr:MULTISPECIES: DUF2975 domain-containing protein [unclassified Lysinibacillus]
MFPTYIALYRLLININQHKAFSASSVKALRTIKYCTFTIALFLALGIAASIIMLTDKEDITGIMMLALICIFTSSSIAMFAAILHQLLQITVELQYENELTV